MLFWIILTLLQCPPTSGRIILAGKNVYENYVSLVNRIWKCDRFWKLFRSSSTINDGEGDIFKDRAVPNKSRARVK